MSSDCDQPAESTNIHDATLPPKNPSRKRKERHSKEKLPTPPPDPNVPVETQQEGEGENPHKENEVLDYIESLHRMYSRSSSTFAPAIVTEEAFDHLDKLYKLMEQMLDLREQNAKLHRRIRDLEHLHNLEKLQNQSFDICNIAEAYPDLDRDTAFAESILESILRDTAAKNKELQKQSKSLRPSILRKDRSGSVTDKQVTLDGTDDSQENRTESTRESIKANKTAKISKWTKVKAAFRWEKASTSVGDHKSQDSGIQVSGVHMPVNCEVARYLRVPSTSDDAGHSPGDSGAGISTPGTISSASSTDDFHRARTCDDRSSDDENCSYIPQKSKPARRHSHHIQSSKTPWGKVKDIIHTQRSSLKKKHRLSAASDDIQIDVEFCSDAEDVFLDDATNPNKSAQISLSPSPNIPSCSSASPSEVPPDIVERYQRFLTEDSASDSETKSSSSRWSRVRKAFLSPHDRRHSTGLHRHSSESHLPLNCLKTRDNSIEEEIQRNYRNLQKKLSLEFQEKLHQWDRLKQNSPGLATSPSCSYTYADEAKDPSFMKKMEEWERIKKQNSPTSSNAANEKRIPMTREYELPPEFKKKLQEWEKIKKGSAGCSQKKRLREVGKWKSLGGQSRPDHSPVFEYPALTDEFRKKLDEWKQIKASGGPLVHHTKRNDKTPSPTAATSRRNSSPRQSKTKQKEAPSKEIHWFEKELGKIEKHKQRLEREKQKFEEREERLSILRRAVSGHTTKKEVLIHTPSGFHRFEGISRKFTQKLYEWEKSQGIAPECSTFALLSKSKNADSSSSKPKSTLPGLLLRHLSTGNPPHPHLQRSWSADSITVSSMNPPCPLISAQPSSLSLNDMQELEKELVTSKTSSLEGVEDFLMHSENNLDCTDEPEAVLVEVEDYEEETAEPLRTFMQHHQMPIYQREGVKFLCEGETLQAPKVRRSESARAQTSYDLIENTVRLLIEVNGNEESINNITDNEKFDDNTTKTKLKVLNEVQIELIKKVIEKLTKLQEENTLVTQNAKEEKDKQKEGKLTEAMDAVQDISTELIQIADQIEQTISKRANLHEPFNSFTIFENINDMRLKMSDLRRHLSYVCAATDLTSPKSKRKNLMKPKLEVNRTLSNDSKGSKESASDCSRKSSKKEKKFIKWETGNSSNNQSAIKKRIKYRQKTQKCSRDTDEDEDNEDTDSSKTSSKALNVRQHKKVTRTRSISDTHVPKLDPKLLMPTAQQFDSTTSDSRIDSSPSESAVSLFVKTTRKLFVPLIEGSFNKSMTTSSDLSEPKAGKESRAEEKSSQKADKISTLPPLPPSPVPQRKVYKDVSPGIRLMISKYNQKISENADIKSGGSSGSNSPVAWRSPVLERRVKAQTEKYQEDLKKQITFNIIDCKREILKSSSAAAILSSTSKSSFIEAPEANMTTIEERNFGQSSETKNQSHWRKDLTLNIALANINRNTNMSTQNDNTATSPELRMRKIQKAKEEFLKSGPLSAPPNFSEECLTYPTRNRLSQISVGSGSSNSSYCGMLVKSVSAGMINVEANAYRRIDPEYHSEGHVTLPRSSSKKKDLKKSKFSSIASKFRKMKMRRGKDKNKAKDDTVDKDKETKVEENKETIETLCRQSLLVDVHNESIPGCSGNNNIGELRGEDTNESTSHVMNPVAKSGSWIKRNLFKK